MHHTGNPMKILFLSVLTIGVLLADQSCADEFPASYIRAQLEEAKKNIEISLNDIKPGQLVSVDYVGHPIWVYRRTASDLRYLKSHSTVQLADPAGQNWRSSIESSHRSSSSLVWVRLLMLSQPPIEKTPYRSLTEDYFIVGAWSPHSGCALKHAKLEHRPTEWVPFFDVCRGVWFDVAGRALKAEIPVLAGQPKQWTRFNLFIPPHYYVSNTRLIIGLPKSTLIPKIDVVALRNYRGMTATEKLIAAALNNDLTGVKSALQDGAKADFYAVGNGSPFDAAIIGSSMEVIELLVSYGARPTPNSRNAATFVKRNDVLVLIDRLENK